MIRATQLAGRLSAAVVLAVASAGCVFGGGSASIDESALERIVLKQEDVPRGFMSFDAGPLQAADGPRGESGWKARYRRSGSPSTRGPLVIESRVDRFEDAGGAEGSLEEVTGRLRQDGWSDAGSAELGEEGLALQQRQEAVTPVQYFMVVWREANVVASLTVTGFAGRVTLAEAVELARAQQRRIDAAG